MSNTLPRKPVHLVPQNAALLQKADAGQIDGGTDYVNNVTAVNMRAIPQTYRTPIGRVKGNEMFKRYLNGNLAVDYCVQKVIEAVHNMKFGVATSPEDRAVLTAMFPGVPAFGGADEVMAVAVSRVNIRISPMERELIRQRVAAHFAEEINWNAGLGGGSVPGRSSTYRPG